MFQHILIPLDGSPRAETPLEYGIGLAKEFGGRITLLQAVTLVPDQWGWGHTERMRAQQMTAAQEYLETCAQTVRASGVNVQSVVLPGEASKAILNFTVEKGVDAIVMNSHGLGGLAGYVFGSVAEKVVKAAACPVLVLHERPSREELEEQQEREAASFDQLMSASWDRL